MKNSSQPAFPLNIEEWNPEDRTLIQVPYLGVTKREYFAVMALQGVLVKGGHSLSYSVNLAVQAADELLQKLEETS